MSWCSTTRCPARGLAALLILLTGFGAVSCQAENLLQSWQWALHSDPTLAQAQANLDADLQSRPLARSAWWPHMGLSAGFGENTAGITGLGNPISQSYPSNNFSVNLTQTVFNGQAWTALAQADNRIQASEAALVYSQQQLALKLSNAYFGVLQAEAQNRVAEEQEKLLDTLNQQTRATLEVGTGDVIAVHEAQARLDAARSERIRAHNAVTVARRALQRLTHQETGTLADLGSFQPLLPQPDKSADWVASALQNQPLIHQNEAQLRIAQEQVEFNRRARWPVVNVQGISQHVMGAPFPNLDINQKGASLNLTMPLFDGGQISATVDQAQAQARASLQELQGVRDQVTLNTQTAFLNLEDSVAELEAAKTQVASSKISLEGTRTGYEVGTRSIVDVLNIATDYIRSEQTYNQALYNHVMARITLKAAAGILTVADLESVNALLHDPTHPLPP